MKILSIFMAILIVIVGAAVFAVTQNSQTDFDFGLEDFEDMSEPYNPIEGFEGITQEGDDFTQTLPSSGNNQIGSLEGSSVRSYDNLLQMTMPDGWEIAEPGELNEDACIELKNDRQVKYAIAIMESKMDFDTDLRGYGELVYNMVSGERGGNLLGALEAQTVNGKQMYFYTMDVIEDGLRSFVTTYLLETQNYYCQVSVYSTRSNMDWVVENAPLFAASVAEI